MAQGGSISGRLGGMGIRTNGDGSTRGGLIGTGAI